MNLPWGADLPHDHINSLLWNWWVYWYWPTSCLKPELLLNRFVDCSRTGKYYRFLVDLSKRLTCAPMTVCTCNIRRIDPDFCKHMSTYVHTSAVWMHTKRFVMTVDSLVSHKKQMLQCNAIHCNCLKIKYVCSLCQELNRMMTPLNTMTSLFLVRFKSDHKII